MSGSHQPLVSVVTPAYNGEKYIAECIESVLGQTYENWEYVVVDNCSTDRTLEIANAHAKKDPRIRVHNNSEFLKIIPNWNHALRQISPESKYCKIVHADDWLFPECIERMVAVAEQHPTVGLVGAYRLRGTQIKCVGLPYSVTVISGREVCHATFRRDYYLFGSPTSTLIRADLIRRRETFYNEHNLHADLEACFDVLQESDFGFVHQLLTTTRVHEETHSQTFVQRYATIVLGRLTVLKKYGRVYCNNEEYRKYLNEALDRYYRHMAVSFFRLRGREFWRYQRKRLEEIGIRFSTARLMSATSLQFIDLALNPKMTVEIIRREMRRPRDKAINH